MFDLSGMTALVTGASGGLGSAIAKALAGQGARLAVSGSNADKLESFRASLGGEHVALPCNLSDGAAVDALVPAAVGGTAMEPIASCTTPMLSKIEVTLNATQPEMLAICHAIGSAVATAPRPISPRVHSHTATAAVAVIMAAFSVASAKPFSVTSRICRRNASVSASTPWRA